MTSQTKRTVHAAGAGIGLLSLSVLCAIALHNGTTVQSLGTAPLPLGGGASVSHPPPLPSMQMGKTAVMEGPALMTTTTTAPGH